MPENTFIRAGSNPLELIPSKIGMRKNIMKFMMVETPEACSHAEHPLQRVTQCQMFNVTRFPELMAKRPTIAKISI